MKRRKGRRKQEPSSTRLCKVTLTVFILKDASLFAFPPPPGRKEMFTSTWACVGVGMAELESWGLWPSARYRILVVSVFQSFALVDFNVALVVDLPGCSPCTVVCTYCVLCKADVTLRLGNSNK